MNDGLCEGSDFPLVRYVSANLQQQYDYAANYNLRRFDEAHSTLTYDDPLRPDRVSAFIPDGGDTFAIDYDGNGNLLKLPGQQFEYNSKNELARFSNGGVNVEYHYDHVGSRISKTIIDMENHVTKIFYIGDQVEIRNGTPTYFMRVGSMRVAVLTGGTIHFIHENGLGSTAFYTDSTGQRTAEIRFHSFGNIASSKGSIDFQTFSLHPIDTESGLVYMLRRYYSPRIGRFLTPDLMAIYQPEKFLHSPQGLHLYAFVANDPVNKTDPTGMSFWTFIGAVGGAILGVMMGFAILAAAVATGGFAGVLVGIALTALFGGFVTGISYYGASIGDPNSPAVQILQGLMIGFNAGMNSVLATYIFSSPKIGVALGVINFLASFETVSRNPVYQGILGWSSWLIPMSWGATGLGVVTFGINLINSSVTFQQWDVTKIDRFAVDWKTGSIVMVGGLIRNPTAFDLGNFVFMKPSYLDSSSERRSYEAILRHETGHTLSVAAFGTIFGIADLVGENIVGLGSRDYGEMIAESHANRPPLPTIPMWG